MKRIDLMRRLQEIAMTRGQVMSTHEEGKHTKVKFNNSMVTVVPRHKEINELTAKRILKQAKGTTR